MSKRLGHQKIVESAKPPNSPSTKSVLPSYESKRSQAIRQRQGEGNPRREVKYNPNFRHVGSPSLASLTSSLMIMKASKDTAVEEKEKPIRNPKSRYCFQYGGGFRKKYGLITCVKIIISATVVSGILRSPNQVFDDMHNSGVTLLIWFSYGLVACLGALVYAELAATFPVSTGDYAYLNESLGPMTGFLYQWSAILVFVPCINAVLAYIVAQNLVAPFINIATISNPTSQEQCGITLLAVGVILLITYLASTNPQPWDGCRSCIFFLKIFLFGILFICGIIYVSQFDAFKHTGFQLGEPSSEYPKIVPNRKILAGALEVVKAIFLAAFSFMGFNSLNFIAEDIRKPSMTIPAAIFISTPIILVTYLTLLFLYFAVLSQNDVGDYILIYIRFVQQSISTPSLNHYVEIIIPTLVVVAIGGTILFRIVIYSRLIFIGSRRGHLPKILGLVSITTNFPVVAAIFLAILSCLYLLCISLIDLETFIIFPTNVELPFMALSTFALIYMRISHPDIQRPFKLHIIFPITFATICTALFFAPFVTLVLDSSLHHEGVLWSYIGLIGGIVLILFTGIPIYVIFLGGNKEEQEDGGERPSRRKCLHCCYVLQGRVMVLAQKCFLALPEKQFKEEKKEEKKEEFKEEKGKVLKPK